MLIKGIVAQSQLSFVNHSINWNMIVDNRVCHIKAQVPMGQHISWDSPCGQACLLASGVPCRQEECQRVDDFEGHLVNLAQISGYEASKVS